MVLSRLAMKMQLHSGKEKFGLFCIYLPGSGERWFIPRAGCEPAT